MKVGLFVILLGIAIAFAKPSQERHHSRSPQDDPYPRHDDAPRHDDLPRRESPNRDHPRRLGGPAHRYVDRLKNPFHDLYSGGPEEHGPNDHPRDRQPPRDHGHDSDHDHQEQEHHQEREEGQERDGHAYERKNERYEREDHDHGREGQDERKNERHEREDHERKNEREDRERKNERYEREEEEYEGEDEEDEERTASPQHAHHGEVYDRDPSHRHMPIQVHHPEDSAPHADDHVHHEVGPHSHHHHHEDEDDEEYEYEGDKFQTTKDTYKNRHSEEPHDLAHLFHLDDEEGGHVRISQVPQADADEDEDEDEDDDEDDEDDEYDEDEDDDDEDDEYDEDDEVRVEVFLVPEGEEVSVNSLPEGEEVSVNSLPEGEEVSVNSLPEGEKESDLFVGVGEAKPVKGHFYTNEPETNDVPEENQSVTNEQGGQEENKATPEEQSPTATPALEFGQDFDYFSDAKTSRH